jgi:hypothetical protein
MALQSTDVGESFRNDTNAEVAATVASAGMTDVAVALINDFQLSRRESRLEARADASYAIARHGRT